MARALLRQPGKGQALSGRQRARFGRFSFYFMPLATAGAVPSSIYRAGVDYRFGRIGRSITEKEIGVEKRSQKGIRLKLEVGGRGLLFLGQLLLILLAR
ncbi:MAG TPA: hypothetical protein VIN35_11830 [Hydrogenophaga sp.]